MSSPPVVTTESCIFCRIVAGEIPAEIIAENEGAIAFRDMTPQAPVHSLVVPRRHIASLAHAVPCEAADRAMLGDVMLLAAQVAQQEGVAESGYRTVLNSGADAGQSVSHLHAHVLGGRALAWPPG